MGIRDSSKIDLTLCNFCVMIRKRQVGAALGLRRGYAPGGDRVAPRAGGSFGGFSKEADGARAAAGSASTYLHVR